MRAVHVETESVVPACAAAGAAAQSSTAGTFRTVTYETTANSIYHSMQVSATRRFSRGFQFGVGLLQASRGLAGGVNTSVRMG